MATTLTLEIQADEEGGEHVRFASFIAQLESFREVLRHTERVMYGSEGNVYYRIAGLSQNSPALVTIEAVAATPRTSEFGPAILDGVLDKLETLSEAGDDWVPGDLDLPALLAYQEFAPTSKRHISELVVRNGRRAIHLDEAFGHSMRKAIGPDEVSLGEVDGSLEVVNLHGKPRFEIYPAFGSGKVTCRFTPNLKREVIVALDHYVRVAGRLHYKRWAATPHAVDIATLTVLPRDEDITPIEALRGVAPELSEKDVEDAKASLWW